MASEIENEVVQEDVKGNAINIVVQEPGEEQQITEPAKTFTMIEKILLVSALLLASYGIYLAIKALRLI